jgi:hypothetical protein
MCCWPKLSFGFPVATGNPLRPQISAERAERKRPIATGTHLGRHEVVGQHVLGRDRVADLADLVDRVRRTGASARNRGGASPRALPSRRGTRLQAAASTRLQYYALHFADVIRNFRSRALKRFSERGEESRIRADHRTTVRDILARLNAASGPEDMNLPGFRLDALRHEPARFQA